MRDGDGVGRRIATYRRRRGLSQAALAGLIGSSPSRGCLRWSVESALSTECQSSGSCACASRRGRCSWLGRPWQLARNGNTWLAPCWTSVPHSPATTSFGSSGSVHVFGPCRAARRSRRAPDISGRAVRRRGVGALPDVLAAVEGFPGRRNGERREALLAYVSAYAVAAKLVTKLGAGDLALLAADRAATAAVDAESRTARGMAGYQVACALLQADQVERWERLAVGLAGGLTPHARSDHPALVSVAGALWLIAAIAAGRRTDRLRLGRASTGPTPSPGCSARTETTHGPPSVPRTSLSTASR